MDGEYHGCASASQEPATRDPPKLEDNSLISVSIGRRGFTGAVYEGSFHWFLPRGTPAVGMMRLSSPTGAATEFNSWPDGFTLGGDSFRGGSFDGERIWLAPRKADRMISFHVRTYVFKSHWTFPVQIDRNEAKFFGAVMDAEGSLWLIPNSIPYLVRATLYSESMSPSLSLTVPLINTGSSDGVGSSFRAGSPGMQSYTTQ